MITERRFGFRFSIVEGGLLFGSVLLTSFLIFVSGVYVGREIAGRKAMPHSQVVHLPVSSFGGQSVVRATATNDSAPVRTASNNAPLAWPVTKEKTSPPAPPTTRPEPLPSQANAPVTEGKVQRVVPSPYVNDENGPLRAKPVGEPFTPKSPSAVDPQTEKTAPAVAARVENVDRKPSPLTVAHVEKAETPVRPRASAAEVKRPIDGKSNETKPGLTAAKKTEKPSAGWRVQVGATTYQETAQDMARELRELGYSPLVSKVQMNGETLYRVRIGKFNKHGEAAAAVGRFRREGRFSQAYLVSE
jgi:cell division septation protein DedD